MLELDFAYFNLIDKEKKGLIAKQFWLEILTPIFFQPRLENLIDLKDIEAKGCNIILPLGINNLQILNKPIQEKIINKSLNIMQQYNIDYMAVDRKLKPYFQGANDNLIFGDNFIKALANVLVKDTLNKYDLKKIIIIGETSEFSSFLEVIASYELPLSMQNNNPSQYEIISHRLLYEKGYAISNSIISPNSWQKGDIILYFNSEIGGINIIIPEICYIEFTNNKVDIDAELQDTLQRYNISLGINSLAPIIETCLLNKRGFSRSNGEQIKAMKLINGREFLELQALGDNLGIWSIFLDNGI